MAFKFCPECGYKLDREYKFCPECGYKLLSENSSSQSFAKSINDNEELFSDVSFDFSALENAFDEQIQQEEKQNEEYENNLKKAKIYCIRGKYLQAKAIYDEILKENAGDINAHIGILRTISKNLKEYDEEKIEAQFNFLNKFSTKDKLIKAEPEIANFYKVKEQYFIDKEIARKNELLEAEYQKARDNFKKLTKPKFYSSFDIYLGSYPQSLKKDDVSILLDEPDKENGYYVGSDYNYYKLFNGKYFLVEPVLWHKLRNDSFLFYSLKILTYSTFGYKCEYEDSQLKKVLKEFCDEFNPSKQFLVNMKYSSPHSNNPNDKIIDRCDEAIKYYKNGMWQKKDESEIFCDCIFPLQISEVEKSVSIDPYKGTYTAYALEQYRVLKRDENINMPSRRYWTRNISTDGYVFVGDMNQKAFKYDNLLDKDEFKQDRASIAGVRPMINIDYNEYIKYVKEHKNGI